MSEENSAADASCSFSMADETAAEPETGDLDATSQAFEGCIEYSLSNYLLANAVTVAERCVLPLFLIFIFDINWFLFSSSDFLKYIAITHLHKQKD